MKSPLLGAISIGTDQRNPSGELLMMGTKPLCDVSIGKLEASHRR